MDITLASSYEESVRRRGVFNEGVHTTSLGLPALTFRAG